MKKLTVGKFEIRLMEKTDAELKQVQAFRYQYLLRDYNPGLPLEGFDDDGYDEFSDSLLVIDTEKNIIVGTYRLATPQTIKDAKYLTEFEYDITPLKQSGQGFVELGRAAVHPDYRNGFVIQLLFLGLYNYAVENGCQYMIGLCSFHGIDPTLYPHAMMYLKKEYLSPDFKIHAINKPFSFDMIKEDELDYTLAKEQMPGLLRMYLNLGAKVGCDGFIDEEFKSCDVLILTNVSQINMRYLERIMRIKVS
ncbi:MAG: GNAT family N-acetyltransferase [Bacilli bacterium]|nr:GNAT family N-acetyltransferase [Bacilli bacterium]